MVDQNFTTRSVLDRVSFELGGSLSSIVLPLVIALNRCDDKRLRRSDLLIVPTAMQPCRHFSPKGLSQGIQVPLAPNRKIGNRSRHRCPPWLFPFENTSYVPSVHDVTTRRGAAADS